MCTQRVQSSLMKPRNTIVFVLLTRTTQVHNHSPVQTPLQSTDVHSCMDANNTERFIPAYAWEKDKYAPWHVDTHTQKWIYISSQIWALSGRGDLQCLAGDCSYQDTETTWSFTLPAPFVGLSSWKYMFLEIEGYCQKLKIKKTIPLYK